MIDENINRQPRATCRWRNRKKGTLRPAWMARIPSQMLRNAPPMRMTVRATTPAWISIGVIIAYAHDKIDAPTQPRT
jgi:hypothetical protein